MRHSPWLLLTLGLALTACSEKEPEDTDGDGLTDEEEAELGSDPTLADTDGDGLEDGAEVEAGTDPTMLDTDEDTYWDSWEIAEGTDPTDDDDRIYEGYWPYQPDKDAFEASDWDDFDADSGEQMPATILVDQWGDEVDLFDFAGQGKYIMLDVSAIWCGPCNGLASWLSGGSDSYGYDSSWPEIKELVEGEYIYWITVLIQDRSGGDVDVDELEDWYDDYEDPYVPVFADNEHWIQIAPAYPSMYLFDEDMELEEGPGNLNHYRPMDVLAGMAEEIMEDAED